MEFNHKKMYQLMGLIAFGIVLFLGLQNIPVLTGVLRTTVRFLLPFLIGCVIAFVVNVPMRAIERTLFSERVQQKYKICRKLHRPLSLVLTLVLIVGLMMLLIFTITPQVSNSIQTIRAALPGFFAQLTDLINDLVVQYPEITDYANDWIASLETINWTEQLRNLFDFLRNGNLLGNTVSVATSIIGGFTNTIIGLIFALYILLQKEKLALQFKKLMYANLAERHVDTALDIFRLIQRTFSNFISGQCLEACILGFLFFVTMSIFGFPYAAVIGIVIAFTALIPIFGAFFGCFIGTFLILIQNPIQAVWFIILFLVLQQIEGNLIYPHVVGNSVGLPSIWVLVAVTTGASTMGILGMIINIPLFSVIYALLRRYTYRELSQKHIPPEKLQ
ncbi:MAG: AI-2E family transporter [Butyricicoccus pullicaecorum]|nr:AI-2E family transporter [Butyricicoccus pullicaecorum]